MTRRASDLAVRIALACLAVASWALVSLPAAGAAPTPPATPVVTAKGTAAGPLQRGATIRMRLQATDSSGWQRIEAIEVALKLRDQPLDRMVVVPNSFSVVIVNRTAPLTIGNEGVLQGPYFRVDTAKMTVTARRNSYILAFPVRLVAAPPPGARLFLSVRDVSGVAPPEKALTPPVTDKGTGFPWGTIGLAVAAALFIGAFVGNTFSTRRTRIRPNVYASVSRRLEEERSKR
jgi:hypothetical protein